MPFEHFLFDANNKEGLCKTKVHLRTPGSSPWPSESHDSRGAAALKPFLVHLPADSDAKQHGGQLEARGLSQQLPGPNSQPKQLHSEQPLKEDLTGEQGEGGGHPSPPRPLAAHQRL